MKANRMLGLAGLAVLLLPALAAAQHTTYDFDKTARFTDYHTFALKDGTSTGDPFVDTRIVAAVGDQLTLKGLSKTNVSPDVYVVFNMAYDKQQEFSAFSTGPMYGGYGLGWGWGWGGWGGWGPATTDVYVRDILVGTLSVDLVDAKSGLVVWRGIATKEVDTDDDPGDRDKSVAKAVYKIFKHYPPGFDDD